MIAKQHIPNWLTYSRIAAIPLIVAAWYAPFDGLAWLPLALFVYASFTDFLDGYLARKWKVESAMGRMLDPIADKLLVAVALILLTAEGLAPAIAVCTIIFREVFVSGIREAVSDKNVVLHVTFLAKCKTAVQMIATAGLLFVYALPCDDVLLVSQGALWLAASLTLVTGWNYFRAAMRVL